MLREGVPPAYVLSTDEAEKKGAVWASLNFIVNWRLSQAILQDPFLEKQNKTNKKILKIMTESVLDSHIPVSLESALRISATESLTKH